MTITVHDFTPMLEVFDLPVSVAFYRDVLGFEMIAGDELWWCMLKLGGVTLMLNTAYERDERPPTPAPERVRGHGDASLYFAVADLDAVYAHLQAKGWAASAPATTSYGRRQVATRDPDGFQIVFLTLATAN